MPKRPSRSPTWIEVAVSNAGFRKANTALVWAMCWAIVREVIADDPTVEQVADWWSTPYRTAYREQAAFREAFPTLDSPTQMLDAPETREHIANLAKAMQRSDEKKKSRRALPDLSVLQLGMARAIT